MPVERLSPKLSMSSRMKGKKQQFQELTPDRRPQDSHGDGTGLRFETAGSPRARLRSLSFHGPPRRSIIRFGRCA
jgi:hypothetical protein